MARRRRSAGLVMVELAAAVAVVLVLGALLLVAAGESRRQASLGDNLANLKQFAAGTGAYAADFDDQFWTFTWRAGVDYGFGVIGSTQAQAVANQAWHILRTRTGQPQYFGSNTPLTWFPSPTYSHLVLLDYLDGEFPARFTISPGDRARLLWQSRAFDFEMLSPPQRPAGSGFAVRRWPFSSSYEISTAFFAPDARQLNPHSTTVEQEQGGDHYRFLPGSAPLGGRRLSEVAFPSQKAMMYDSHQRHFGPREAYFMYGEARVPVLAADGSVAVRRTAEANLGFRPNDPRSNTASLVRYTPDPGWEPPTLSGFSSDLLHTHYRFTRSGLRGRDFGGPAVPWVD